MRAGLRAVSAAIKDYYKPKSAPKPAPEPKTGLPTEAKARKDLPIATGVLDYFPLAIAAVSRASLAGQKQHLNGGPLKWDKSKSQDHADCLVRHLMERGKIDSDGVPHSAKAAWRALALLQLEEEGRK